MHKFVGALVALGTAGAESTSETAGPTPIDRVLTLMDRLDGETVEDAKTAQSAYNDQFHLCDKEISATKTSLDNDNDKLEEARAKHNKAVAEIDNLDAAIADHVQAATEAQAKLVEAKKQRDEENALFKETQTELQETEGALLRAIPIVEKGMQAQGGKQSDGAGDAGGEGFLQFDENIFSSILSKSFQH